MIPKHEYREAIIALELAMTQLQPDGNNCVVCGDNGHQAWECLHNPLVMVNKGFKLEDSWRCFHCNRVYIDPEKAAKHFGNRDSEKPACCKVVV